MLEKIQILLGETNIYYNHFVRLAHQNFGFPVRVLAASICAKDNHGHGCLAKKAQSPWLMNGGRKADMTLGCPKRILQLFSLLHLCRYRQRCNCHPERGRGGAPIYLSLSWHCPRLLPLPAFFLPPLWMHLSAFLVSRHISSSFLSLIRQKIPHFLGTPSAQSLGTSTVGPQNGGFFDESDSGNNCGTVLKKWFLHIMCEFASWANGSRTT